MKVDSEAHFNGLVCTDDGQGNLTWQLPPNGDPVGPDHYPQPGDSCVGTWEQTDLSEENIFFDLVDVKPGDEGENTISLHVINNDAWGQFSVTNVLDLDNSCTEPEGETELGGPNGDPGCTSPQGELGQSITFDAWLDQGSFPGFQCNNPEGEDPEDQEGARCPDDPNEGDNIRQTGEGTFEPLFWEAETVDEVSEGPFDFADVLAGIYQAFCNDQNGGDPTGNTNYESCHGLAEDGRMVGSVTYYFGLAWNIPEGVGNEAQTDSLSANMVFDIEQHRNNPNPF